MTENENLSFVYDGDDKALIWKVSVVGLDLIFEVLCLIAKIMIYRLPVRDSIDRMRVDNFKEELKELQSND